MKIAVNNHRIFINPLRLMIEDSDVLFIAGTNTLINKLNIRDPGHSSKILKRKPSWQRMREVLPVIDISSAGYCKIHHHLFQDVYDWAGKPEQFSSQK